MLRRVPFVLGSLAGALAIHAVVVASGARSASAGPTQGDEDGRTRPVRIVTASEDPAQLARFDVAPARSDAQGSLTGVRLTDGPFVVTATHTASVLHLWVVARGADCGAMPTTGDTPGRVIVTGSFSSYQRSHGARVVVRADETLCAANAVGDNAVMLARVNASNDAVSGFRPY